MDIRELSKRAKAGKLNGLTVFKTKKGYQVSYQASPGGGWNVCIADDPVFAIETVLEDTIYHILADEDLIG